MKIKCEWLETRRILVNPDGQVWPCCFFCNSAFKYQNIKSENILESIENSKFLDYFKYKDELNIKSNNLKDILNHKWFTEILPNSWNDEEARSVFCVRNCSVEND